MNTSKVITIFFISLFSILAVSCKKDNSSPNEHKTGELSIEFDHIVGDDTFTAGSRIYKNANDEPFTISTLRYFISNIILYEADGSEFLIPQDDSYFLIDGANRESRFAKVVVPEGDYTRVSFIVGVDSLRSTLPVEERKGVLSFDPDHGHEGGGMYWGWNSGYIFFKLEGSSTAVGGDGKFRYHIGGFGGYNAPTINNIKKVTISLEAAGNAIVRQGLRSNVHLLVDVLRIFNGPHTFSIAAHPNVMFSEYSVFIANNFPSLFSHDHTENYVKSEKEL